MARLALLTLVVALAFAPAASARPEVTGFIRFPGLEPLAVGVHEGLNKVFVSEDNQGLLHVVDGATRQTLNTVPVGGASFSLAVNETHRKVYVASDKACCTQGITEGNGLVSVVDAGTHQLIAQFDLGLEEESSASITLANDEVHGKVYVTATNLIGVIDVATDQFTRLTPVPDPFDGPFFSPSEIAINTVTNKAYVADQTNNAIVVVDGNTGAMESIPLSRYRARTALALAVGENENKLYVTVLHQPRVPEIGILILDQDTGSHEFVGRDDLEPLVFNQRTNRLFAGLQVGERAAVVNGRSDRLRYVNLRGSGIGSSAVRVSSDNAYHVNNRRTFIVNGRTRCVTRLTTGTRNSRGLAASVAIAQSTGTAYVINSEKARAVAIIDDDRVPCRSRRGRR